MNDIRVEALKLIKKHEGLKLYPYKCTSGANTIGYGHNLDALPLPVEKSELDKFGITKAEAQRILEQDFDRCHEELTQLPWFNSLSPVRQIVLLDMCYNLGIVRLGRFRKMIAAIKIGEYQKAANEMIDSVWAEQVKSRAITLAKMMAEDRL